jgi:uncharacterized protein YndB with AHSA1/START domain
MVFGNPVGRRIWSALTAGSIVVTGTILVFVLINICVAYWYPRDAQAIVTSQPVFADHLRPVYEGIYGLPIAVVREIVAEAFMENAWLFEPYVQFRERPREGRHVNISTDGFRLNGRTARNTVDPARPLTVFLFGGSTTFGYGVRDQDTIAAHLEALLSERHPEDAHRIAVYNFGRGYYSSGQELLLLKSLVHRGIVPKVAVFIDGVNEHFCPAFSANIAEIFRIVQHDPGAKLREIVASLPVARLVSPSYRTELAANALYVNRGLEGYAFECGCPREATCHAQLLQTYSLNKHLVRAMAKELGFEAHFVLQPVGGFRNRFTTSPYGERRSEHSWFLWGEFERHSMNGENDHSFAGLLENYEGEAFVDMLHYSAGANRLIAERLYPSVARSLANVRAARSTVPASPSSGQAEAAIHVAVDPAMAFAYFTVPARVVRWMGRSARIRPVPGGPFHVEIAKGQWIRGAFVDLDPSHRIGIAFPWAAVTGSTRAGESRVEISLTPHQGGTLVRVVHSGLPAGTSLAYQHAWQQSLTRLARTAAKTRTPH